MNPTQTEPAAAGARRPESHLAGAFLVTLLCCLPLGIDSIVHACKVSTLFVAGDHAGAQEASEKAKKWMWLGFWIGLVCIILSVVFQVVAALLAA